jgi:hypothetical protein
MATDPLQIADELLRRQRELEAELLARGASGGQAKDVEADALELAELKHALADDALPDFVAAHPLD